MKTRTWPRTGMMTLVVGALVLLASSCSVQQFSGSISQSKRGAADQNCSVNSPSQKLAAVCNTPVNDATARTVAIDNTAVVPNALPGAVVPSRQLRLLFIDLKSGWWVGDGGEFAPKFLAPLLKRVNAVVTADYFHITSAPNVTHYVFAEGGVKSKTDMEQRLFFEHVKSASPAYDEIWILSGFDGNVHGSIPAAGLGMLYDYFHGSKAAFFIGGGVGAFAHSNDILGGVFGLSLQIDCGELDCGNTGRTPIAEKYWDAATDLVPHRLFQGVSRLVETSKGDSEAPVSISSDRILGNETNFTFLAPNKAIAVSTTGRRMVLDAGLHRYFPIEQGDADMAQYFVNLVSFLGNVD